MCEHLDADIDGARLGAWKVEAELRELIVTSKKGYYAETVSGEIKQGRKGTIELTKDEYIRMLAGETIETYASKAPLIKPDGSQHYIKRRVKATAGAPTPLFDIS